MLRPLLLGTCSTKTGCAAAAVLFAVSEEFTMMLNQNIVGVL